MNAVRQLYALESRLEHMGIIIYTLNEGQGREKRFFHSDTLSENPYTAQCVILVTVGLKINS